MKKRIFALLLALIAVFGLLAGCSSAAPETVFTERPEQTAPVSPENAQNDAPPASGPADGADAAPSGLPSGDAAETETALSAPETPAEPDLPAAVDEDGEYTAPEDVAEYLHAYGRLPGNFITKKEAQALGWPGGDLWKYAPGKSIGGDYFGNYEGLLPKDTRYHECDVNYAGGSRGAERLIYGDDGSIYYTDDHYASFTQLY